MSHLRIVQDAIMDGLESYLVRDRAGHREAMVAAVPGGREPSA